MMGLNLTLVAYHRGMVRFAGSTPALSALVALHLSRTGMRLSELARLFGTRTSTMQRALQLLLVDEVIEREGRRYRAGDGPGARASLAFAFAFLPQEALARALSSNRALESIARDEVGIIIAVVRRFPEPLDEARLRAAIGTLNAARPALDVQLIPHHELALRLRAEPALLDRLFSVTTTIGTPLADGPDGPGIRPTRAALRDLARRHGLRRIVAFGSVARGTASPTSDVDLLVQPAADAPGAFRLTSLVADAEAVFGRDVDIVVGEPRDRALREAIATEEVVLYDAR